MMARPRCRKHPRLVMSTADCAPPLGLAVGSPAAHWVGRVGQACLLFVPLSMLFLSSLHCAEEKPSFFLFLSLINVFPFQF